MKEKGWKKKKKSKNNERRLFLGGKETFLLSFFHSSAFILSFIERSIVSIATWDVDFYREYNISSIEKESAQCYSESNTWDRWT